MSKVAKDKINDMRDAAVCAQSYLNLTRCPGGRVLVKGYICPHCEMDTSFGDCGGVEGFVKLNKETF